MEEGVGADLEGKGEEEVERSKRCRGEGVGGGEGRSIRQHIQPCLWKAEAGYQHWLYRQTTKGRRERQRNRAQRITCLKLWQTTLSQ